MKHPFALIGLIVMACMLGSCVTSGSSRVEEDFGNSFRSAKTNQQLNPDAGKNTEPVMGFDGKAAQATLDKYRKDFEKPAAPTPFVLSLGSMGKE